MNLIWILAVWVNIFFAAIAIFVVSIKVTRRDRWLAFGGSLAFGVLLGIALRDVVNSMWFEDDALITFQYSKNLANGCGWNFNCQGDDFATSSFLQALIGAIWFLLADTPRALHLEKLWENVLVIWGSAAYLVASLRFGVARVACLLALALLLLSRNSFQFLFSGMENALGYAFLCFLFLAYAYERWSIVGILVGVLALVRPEYAVSGVILAVLHLAVNHETLRKSEWIKHWSRCASFAVSSFLPLFIFVWFLNGSPFADTLEIKRLTAPNWGAYYHEDLLPFMSTLGPALLIVGFGFVGLLLQRSVLMFFPLFALVISVIYWRLGLPRSPWYYMPFWVGLTSCVLGFPFIVRQLKVAWGIPALDIGKGLKPLFSAVAAVLVLWLAVGNPVVAARQNVEFVEKVASKRIAINTATGLYLRSISEPGDRIAIPNVGYVGFYSDRFIVDLVGLLTPDASLRVSRDGWRTYAPRFYVDKAHVAERLLEIDGYEFRAVIGPQIHRGERFLVLEQVSSVYRSNVVRLDGTLGVRSNQGWVWNDLDFESVDVVDGARQVYVSVSSVQCADDVEVVVTDEYGQTSLERDYVNRGDFIVMDTSTANEIDWGSVTQIVIHCGGSTTLEVPSVLVAVADDLKVVTGK